MLRNRRIVGMLREGSILDEKYRLLEPIGAGGMGAVWKAEKLATYEQFAIKFIHQTALGDESYCTRFGREVAVLRGLRHPNIVDVFDWRIPEPGREPSAYVVMELLEGESLQDVLRRRNRLPPGLVVRLMLQVLDGVAAVHTQGIVHRDLSPANIFLVRTPNPVPRVKILDFGLAKGIGTGNADSAVTQPGSVLGRAAYAAPEIFLDDVDLDVRADIFACGMIMFRALTGRFPYRETKVDLMWAERYAERVKQEPYPAPSRFVSDIPAPVEKIVTRALRKRPGDRYPSATEMQKELLWADNLLPPSQRNITAGLLAEAATPGEGGGPTPTPMPRGASAQAAATAGRRIGGGTLLGAPQVAVPAPAGSAGPRDAPAPKRLERAAATPVTGPVVFGGDPDAPGDAAGVAAEQQTRVFAYSEPAAATAPADTAHDSASGTRAASGSQPSATGMLAGDVASSIGELSVARRRSHFRRPAVLAFSAVALALIVTITLIATRDRAPDRADAPSPTEPVTNEPPGPPSVPTVAAQPVEPARPVATADAGREADATPDAGSPAVAVVAPVRSLDAGTAVVQDAAAVTPSDAATATADDADAPARETGPALTTRDAVTQVAAVRDARAEAATSRDAGTQAATSRDAGTGRTDAGRRDTGTATTPPDDFLTDYETQPRRDAGSSTPPPPPPGGDDFLTDYESGRTP
jgi:hypothetical protein